MRHNDSLPIPGSRADYGEAQEARVAKMRLLLSEFEREIDGSGPLIEAKEVSDLRRELHAGCVLIRESLGSLSDRTLKLQRASQRHEQRAPRTTEGTLTDEEKIRAGLKPELWPRA